VGFFGKIPSRGDFVRSGLPGSFVEPWDNWLQKVLPAARVALGDQWDAIWLEAPVWRFLLPPGQCGPDCVLGLWMPSVDAAGRHFPLTLAAVLPGDAVPDSDADHAWLDCAEEAGRDAIAYDLSPEDLASRLTECRGPPPQASAETGRWWTEGGPYVPASSIELPALPAGDCFAAMLRVDSLTNSDRL
jgi:type VI secretion system protein ImpM